MDPNDECMRRATRLLCSLCLMGGSVGLLVSCGAKTGLPVPVVETCHDLDLERPTPQVLFAVDRSGSMDFSLNGIPRDNPERGDLPSRWEVMSRALTGSLRARAGRLEAGAIFFPELGPSSELGCGGAEFVSVEPGPDTVSVIEQAFASSAPLGGTPTGSVMRVAAEYLANPDPDTVPFVVLVTDGAPNCNPEPAVGPPECVCTSPNTELCTNPDSENAELHCLDDVQSIETIAGLVARGIPVYVVGITRQPTLTEVLNRMADAGGRPRVGPRRFYDAQTEEQLLEALDTITGSITNCAYSLRAPSDPSRVRVFIDETEIGRDPSHQNGWDFTAPDGSVISLFGPACARAEREDIEITADLYCDMPDAGVDAGADAGDAG